MQMPTEVPAVTLSAGLGGSTPVLSLLHIRPLLTTEQACCNIVSVGENETVDVHGRQYAFDCVVGEGGHSRKHMCHHYIRPLVRNVCNGVNCAVLAYGQTSSGKTYTMGIGREQLRALRNGDDEEVEDLVIPFALRELFAYVDTACGSRVFTLLVSFIEVYMEKYYDLLAGRQPVAAKTRSDGEVMLVGAQLRQVKSMEDVIRLLQIGGLARITKGTTQNDRSSRSHAVLTIHVQSRAATEAQPTTPPASASATATNSPWCSPGPMRAASPSCESSSSPEPSNCTSVALPPVRTCVAVDSGSGVAALSAAMAAPPLAAKLHLVDLAGSESVGRAGAVGLAAKEGNNINLSLMTLRNLIQLLAASKASSTRAVLPYRDSKLTMLLRDALGGNSSTLFVACVSPADANAAMTVSTLEFATTARRIRTKPAVNIGGGGSAEVLELHRIILKLRSELEQLRRLALPASLSPQRSPRGVMAAIRTSMTFSAAVAAASMQSPSVSQLPDSSTAPFIISALSVGRRSCTTTVAGTPPLPLLGRISGRGMSSAGSTLAAAAVPIVVGRTASPDLAQAWGTSDCQAFSSLKSAGGAKGKPEEPLMEAVPNPDGVFGERCVNWEEGAGPQTTAGGDDVDRQLMPQPKRHGYGCMGEGTPGKGGQVMPRRRWRRKAIDRQRYAGIDDEHDSPCTSGRDSPGDGSVRLRRVKPSASSGSRDTSDNDRDSNAVLSTSSYEGQSGDSGDEDEWQRDARLQQRIMLLEAENEHLQKHVGHLSSVISELRTQLDDALAARAASPCNLSITPGMSRPVRSSASGASLLGQSMLSVTTARLQRLGASAGGVSRTGTSRMAFSPSPLQDSPYSVFQKPSPMWDPAMRMSVGDQSAQGSSSISGPRRTAMGYATTTTTAHDEAAPNTQDLPLAKGSQSGMNEGRVGSPFTARRRYISDNGIPVSTASAYAAMTAQQQQQQRQQQQQHGLVPAEDGGGGGAAAAGVSRNFHTTSPAVAPALGWLAGDGTAAAAAAAATATVALAESGCTGCSTLPQVAEEPHGEYEEVEATARREEQEEGDDVPTAAAAVPSESLEVDSAGDAAMSLVLSEEDELAAEQRGGLGGAGGGTGLGWSAAVQEDLALAGPQVAPGCDGDRMLSMLSWIGQRVANSESLLATQQAKLRALLSEHGLTVNSTAAAAASNGLPSLDTLQCFAATQLAGVEAELSGLLGSGGQVPSCNSRPGEAMAVALERSPNAHTATAAEESDDARRIELLQFRQERLKELQTGLKRVAELEASLELQREVQMLVAVYAGLSSSDDPGVATGPAVARAAAAAEQQLQALRRRRRQQVVKDAAVAREKLRELETLPGPPTPLEFGVLLQTAGGSSGGGSTLTIGTSGPPSLTLSTSLRSMGAVSWQQRSTTGGLSSGQHSLDVGYEEDEFELERSSGALTPKAGMAAGSGGGGFSVTALAPPPLPPLPPQPVQQQQTPSLLAHLLPALSPISAWRRGGNKDTAHRQPQPQSQPSQHPQHQRSGSASGSCGSQRRVVLQTSLVGPWLDALLDYETRLQQYTRVLAGALLEREAVYEQLQEVERDLAILTEAAAAETLAETGTAAALPSTWSHSGIGASQGGIRTNMRTDCYTSQGGFPFSGRTDGGASFASWMTSPLRAMLKGADVWVQQQAATLSTRQAKLQKRLEELCMEVASLQPAIVEAQESRSAATDRDDWWTCVPSLSLARSALRMLLERAAEYRAAFLEEMARANKWEQQVEELGLQYQEAEARLAALSLELAATRAAALAAVVGPGLNESFSDAVAVLLQQQQQPQQGKHGDRGGGGGGGGVNGAGQTGGTSLLAPISTARVSGTHPAAEAPAAAVSGAMPCDASDNLGGAVPWAGYCDSGRDSGPGLGSS